MKICSLYGPGFYYMPGTDICLKVGGYVRTELGYGDSLGSMTSGPLVGQTNTRLSNNFIWRSRGYITADARQQTAYGTVRGYIAVGLNYDNTTSAAAAQSGSASNIGGAGTTTGFSANRAFIQFAGFTMGTAVSFFDFFNGAAVAYYTGFIPTSDSGDGGVKTFTYTAQFGGGFSASLGIEEPQRTQVIGTGTASAVGAPGVFAAAALTSNPGAPVGGNGGFRSPDVVANLRLDQAWGSAQVMGALHHVETAYYGTVSGTGTPGDKWGYAVGAGLRLNAPMFGPGDYFQAQVLYTEGALRYLNRAGGGGNYLRFSGANFGMGIVTDGVYGGPGTALDLTKATEVNLSYEHFWNPAWQTSVYGGWQGVRYNGNANNTLCAAEFGAGSVLGAAITNGVACNNNFQVWTVGTRTQWNINKNFYIGLDVIYTKLQTASNGATVTTTAAIGANPIGVYSINNQDAYAARLRVHRDFGF